MNIYFREGFESGFMKLAAPLSMGKAVKFKTPNWAKNIPKKYGKPGVALEGLKAQVKKTPKPSTEVMSPMKAEGMGTKTRAKKAPKPSIGTEPVVQAGQPAVQAGQPAVPGQANRAARTTIQGTPRAAKDAATTRAERNAKDPRTSGERRQQDARGENLGPGEGKVERRNAEGKNDPRKAADKRVNEDRRNTSSKFGTGHLLGAGALGAGGAYWLAKPSSDSNQRPPNYY